MSTMTTAEKVLLLHRIADEQNDARDHDEYHAAADVVAMRLGSDYINRWVDGLLAAYRAQLEVRA